MIVSSIKPRIVTNSRPILSRVYSSLYDFEKNDVFKDLIILYFRY
jgi:hypothetical protein